MKMPVIDAKRTGEKIGVLRDAAGLQIHHIGDSGLDTHLAHSCTCSPMEEAQS